MILPDADGFIVAAQKLIEEQDAVFLHDAEGAIVAVLVAKPFWNELDKGAEEGMLRHDHLEPEMGTEVPWHPSVPVVSVTRLPDDRWGAKNERDISDLTLDDLAGIIEAFKLWAGIQWERRGGKP